MMYDVFLNAMKQNSEALALIDSQGIRHSYRDLDIKIRQLGHFFLKNGIGHNSRVALVTRDEDWHFFVCLALDFLQATYVPFDMDTPAQQIKDSLQSLGITTCINDETLPTEAFSMEPLSCDFYLPQKHVSYILGSSGSTGAKKWIPIESDGIAYWTNIIKDSFSGKQRMLCTRSPAFDARIFEYLIALATAGSLHLLDTSGRKSMDSVIEVCKNQGISCLLLIASQLNHGQLEALLSTLKNAGLQYLLTTGDACSPLLVKHCENLSINLLNCYGPTESTFGLGMLCVNGLLVEGEPVPVGLPVSPVKVHFLEGELCIESPFLSPGYLGDAAEKNAAAFPWFNGVRVFKTGDRFSTLSNGLLGFQGRISEDSHVKINGVKVSPAEIQEHINRYQPENIHCLVVVKPWLGRDKPFAYLKAHQPFDREDFRNWLKTSLRKEAFPMVILLEEFPLLVNQKSDRQNLIKRTDDPNSFLFREQGSPQKNLPFQEELSAIWSKLFKIETLSPEDDFLCLGGDSILAMELATEIRKIAPHFLYRDLLALPQITIKTISAALTNHEQYRKDAVLINHLLPLSPQKQNLFLLPALLGEGYFSYRHLGTHLARHWDVNIYTLSDPGIFDESRLPDSLEKAAERYIKAIKGVQEKGPWRLGGFSYGCTLAWKVAFLLEKEGAVVAELHLFDGFPPLLYQKLTTEGHARLLLSLVNFIRETLNNRYYRQAFEKTFYKGLDEIGRIDQITVVFNHLRSELKPESPEADALLQIARRHLYFMQEASQHREKLQVCPELYLTDNSQPYLEVIKDIRDLARDSRDFYYFYWNQYFKNMKRNPVELKIKHNELLQKDLSAQVHQYFDYKPSPHALFRPAPLVFSEAKKPEMSPVNRLEKAFIKAAAENNLPRLKALLPQVNINAKDDEGRTAMHQAIIHNSTDSYHFLMAQKSINLRAVDNQGKMAVDYLDCIFAPVLKELKLPKTLENNLVKFQLFQPEQKKREPLALLMKAYNLSDASQESLAKGLKQAAIENNWHELEEFIGLIRNINAVDAMHRTALHWAALSGKRECFDILKNHAAKDNVKDCHHKTARDYFLLCYRRGIDNVPGL